MTMRVISLFSYHVVYYSKEHQGYSKKLTVLSVGHGFWLDLGY